VISAVPSRLSPFFPFFSGDGVKNVPFPISRVNTHNAGRISLGKWQSARGRRTCTWRHAYKKYQLHGLYTFLSFTITFYRVCVRYFVVNLFEGDLPTRQHASLFFSRTKSSYIYISCLEKMHLYRRGVTYFLRKRVKNTYIRNRARSTHTRFA